MLLLVDTDSVIYSRKPETGTIVDNSKNSREKNCVFDFCKLKNHPEPIAKDNASAFLLETHNEAFLKKTKLKSTKAFTITLNQNVFDQHF